MPPSAVSSRPGLDCTAPVNAPSLVAEQLALQQASRTARRSRPARTAGRRAASSWCRRWASTSLPTPVSPRISTLMVPRATRSTVRYRASICSEPAPRGGGSPAATARQVDRPDPPAGRTACANRSGRLHPAPAASTRASPAAGRAARCRWRCPGPGWPAPRPLRRRRGCARHPRIVQPQVGLGAAPHHHRTVRRQPVGGQPASARQLSPARPPPD